MRCVARALLLAAILLVAGCSLFRDKRVTIAHVTGIAAPDTVDAGTSFNVTVHAVLGPDLRWDLDHVEVRHTVSSLDVRVWARDDSRPGSGAGQRLSEQELTLKARVEEPGEYRIIAHQPDGRDTLKTITVLP
jgi:hypothetical protein